MVCQYANNRTQLTHSTCVKSQLNMHQLATNAAVAKTVRRWYIEKNRLQL